MACMFNAHVVTGTNGLPVASPAAGTNCDCGKTVAQYTASGALVWQESPTGRLMGR